MLTYIIVHNFLMIFFQKKRFLTANNLFKNVRIKVNDEQYAQRLIFSVSLLFKY